jgi:hypothetical protein
MAPPDGAVSFWRAAFFAGAMFGWVFACDSYSIFKFIAGLW